MTAEYIAVAKTSDIAPGTVRVYTVDGEDIAVANVNGEFYAFADICTHDGGPLAEGELDTDECVIECPRHGARFDIVTGEVRALPAVIPIPVYGLKVEGDTVLVTRLPLD